MQRQYVLLMPASAVRGDILPPVLIGESERESDGGFCAADQGFIVGVATVAAEIRVGGDLAGCQGEWGMSLEFDLSQLEASDNVSAATLRLNLTGQNGQPPAVGVFAFT